MKTSTTRVIFTKAIDWPAVGFLSSLALEQEVADRQKNDDHVEQTDQPEADI
jgi:hypothetical protein